MPVDAPVISVRPLPLGILALQKHRNYELGRVFRREGPLWHSARHVQPCAITRRSYTIVFTLVLGRSCAILQNRSMLPRWSRASRFFAPMPRARRREKTVSK